MMHTLYTYGYSRTRPETLAQVSHALAAIVLDARFAPHSRAPGWNRRALEALLGERYQWVKALGNENYKGGDIKLLDAEAGLALLETTLARQNVILLCVCQNVATCHRAHIAALAAEGFGCAVHHIAKGDIAGIIEEGVPPPPLPEQLRLL